MVTEPDDRTPDEVPGLPTRSGGPGLSCRQVVALLGAYVGGDLPAAQGLALEAHLDGCADCGAYLDSYRKTMEVSRRALRWEESKADEAIPDALVRAILRGRKG